MTVEALKRQDVEIPEGVRPGDFRLPPMPARGMRNYWYPVMFSGKLGKKPARIKALGEEIVLVRHQGKPHALLNRCPHRGAPLHLGFMPAPGILACSFHGFSFDVTNGKCVALLTEGPDSPACGKISVKAFPTEERYGLIWVFIGEGTPPPLDDDVPELMREPDAVIVGMYNVWNGHWRVTCDTGIDVTHPAVLHRKHPLLRFVMLPAFLKVGSHRDGPWLNVVYEDVHFEGDFPRIGRWPRDLRFRRKTKGIAISIRLPGIVRIGYPDSYTHFRWGIPIDEKSTLNLQLLVLRARGLKALGFRLYYYLFEKWRYHVSFQKDDKIMSEAIERFSPEYLTQADSIIVKWRRMALEARKPQIGQTT